MVGEQSAEPATESGIKFEVKNVIRRTGDDEIERGVGHVGQICVESETDSGRLSNPRSAL